MSKNTPMISVSNVTKRFGDTAAVDGVSFSVKRGEVFAFLGPNGAGKTTTIKMLTTLLAPTAGELLLDGYDPSRDQDAARRTFGIVFQDPSVDDELTAYENLELHAVLYDVPTNVFATRAQELLQLVELWGKKDEFVKTFSGGMRRRLEIARGLLHHPKILFLDEPTLGLDPQTRNRMWAYVRDINKKEHMTIFFTTHYMEEAEKIADRIAVIDHGRIIAVGTVSQLKIKTKTQSLEEAFLALTGNSMREETVSPTDHMRAMGRMWHRRVSR